MAQTRVALHRLPPFDGGLQHQLLRPVSWQGRPDQHIKTALVMALVSCVIVRFIQLDVVVRKNENVSTVDDCHTLTETRDTVTDTHNLIIIN